MRRIPPAPPHTRLLSQDVSTQQTFPNQTMQLIHGLRSASSKLCCPSLPAAGRVQPQGLFRDQHRPGRVRKQPGELQRLRLAAVAAAAAAGGGPASTPAMLSRSPPRPLLLKSPPRLLPLPLLSLLHSLPCCMHNTRPGYLVCAPPQIDGVDGIVRAALMPRLPGQKEHSPHPLATFPSCPGCAPPQIDGMVGRKGSALPPAIMHNVELDRVIVGDGSGRFKYIWYSRSG